jgi:hypothetical protein
MRGVVTFDTNEILVLVHAPVEAVAEAFGRSAGLGTWVEGAHGQTVTISDPCYLVYRLKGHSWTILDRFAGHSGLLGPDDARSLSEALGTRALHYANSDTAGATGYELFDGGELLERLEAYEGVEFETMLRQVEPPEDGPDIRSFVDTFIREQDAFVPGWSVYLGGWCHKPGDRVQLRFDTEDGSGLDVVERLDYLGA